MTSDLHHLAGAYALDALEPDERAAFEAHYPGCDICRDDVVDYRETASLLASATAAAVPAGVRGRVMAEISATRQISPVLPDRVVDLAERRRDRTRRAGMLAAVAAAIVAIVGFASVLRTDGGNDLEAVFEAPDAVVASMQGDDGLIQVVWSAERDQVVLVGSDVPAVGADQAYALWFLLDDGVAPAGLFSPDESGTVRSLIDVDDLAGNGFGVTIEPASGSDQPTSPVIYSATI
ncbi:MAG: anti-sigma factor [Acidimicrobiales bacterium]